MVPYFGRVVYVSIAVVLGWLILSGIAFLTLLLPVERSDEEVKSLVVHRGMGIKEIAATLKAENLIRSESALQVYALLTLKAHRLQSGYYELSRAMSLPRIVEALTNGSEHEVTVTIPEGINLRGIDTLLSSHGVIAPGALMAFNAQEPRSLEGFLFPDTYRFVVDSSVDEAVKKMTENFNQKGLPIIEKSERGFYDALKIASLIEREVPESTDRALVAGIFLKRLDADWPLQVDAAFCYEKVGKCTLSPEDFKRNSPYNTYLYKGLPPTPIGNPGRSALEAVETPKNSSYWYYLSDPKTGKTVFATSLDEQVMNKQKYLE